MSSLGSTPNFLTFDVEEYYRANYSGFDIRQFEGTATNTEFLVDKLLDLCAGAGIHSTFFVLGSLAEQSPGMVRKIHASGHEVASHGYGHESVYGMTPAAFQADLRKSTAILESVTGEKVIGFRAPSFSVTKKILPWFYAVLEDTGFRYSSSVFPGRTFLYGIPDFPCQVPLLSKINQ